MPSYEICYFTYCPTVPGQNPWWGPYSEHVQASSIGEAREIADSMFGDYHIEYVREAVAPYLEDLAG